MGGSDSPWSGSTHPEVNFSPSINKQDNFKQATIDLKGIDIVDLALPRTRCTGHIGHALVFLDVSVASVRPLNFIRLSSVLFVVRFATAETFRQFWSTPDVELKIHGYTADYYYLLSKNTTVSRRCRIHRCRRSSTFTRLSNRDIEQGEREQRISELVDFHRGIYNVDLHRACGVDSVELTAGSTEYVRPIELLFNYSLLSFHRRYSLYLSLPPSPSLSLSLSFSLSLLTRWLRRPCRTLNLSPRNSLILSTVPTSRLQGPFPTSAFPSFQLFSRGSCTHSCNDTFILDHARIVDDEIVADEQLSSMT